MHGHVTLYYLTGQSFLIFQCERGASVDRRLPADADQSIVTILFIPLSAEQGKLESDWAVVSKILRRRCRSVSWIRLSGMAAAANRLTTRTTTGFPFAAAGANLAIPFSDSGAH